VERFGEIARCTLKGLELATTNADGTSTSRTITTDEYGAIARTLFGIELTPDE
jgi:hypothetical protein